MKELKIPRQVKSQQVKERIFQAAWELMKTHGYEYVTVNNVCSLAEVSIGSFYHHFTNKDELLAYYIVAGYEKYRQRYESVNTEDIVQFVQQMYSLYLEFCMEQGLPFLKNYYSTSNKGLDTRNNTTAENLSTNLPLQGHTVQALLRAQQAGYVQPGEDAMELAEELCTLEKGYIFDWCLSDGAFDLQALSQKAISRYMYSALTPAYFERFGKK